MPLVLLHKARKGRRKGGGGDGYKHAAKAKPRFKNALVASLDTLREDPNFVYALSRATKTGNFATIYQMLPAFDPSDPDGSPVWAEAQAQIEAEYRKVLEAAGAEELARLDLPTSFALDNPYSQAWIDTQTGKLIKDISVETQTVIQGMVRDSFLDGVPVRQLADSIKTQIGLTPSQAESVRRRYDAAIAQGLSPDAAMELMENQAERLLDYRAETIAATETIAAEAAGLSNSWAEAMNQGYLLPGTQREWIASVGYGACAICEGLDQVRVALNQPWTFSTGRRSVSVMAPPAHPRCRCTQALIAPGL